ncbi:MAG: SLBB domain-containing protein [Ignavibacteriales bacterium]|nr:SLBB domain-containing protein [Ignavibacteriales bacterium]
MKIKLLLNIIFTIIYTTFNYGQIDNILNPGLPVSAPNIYNYNNSIAPTIELKIWGMVKNPGVYKVGKGIQLADLLSFAGGISETAELDEIRVIRANPTDNSKIDVIVINYEDLMDKTELNSSMNIQYELFDGDIVIIPKATSWYTDIAPFVQILSILTSIGSLVYIITRIN